MLARVMVIAGLMLLPTAVLADEAARLRALLVEYRCPVVDRLEQIYNAFGGARPRHSFLVVSIGGCPQDYVQCLFNTRTEMLCEAASGFFQTKPDEPRAYRLPAGSIAALGRLGFSTDNSPGNFQILFGVPEPPDLSRVADLILNALHDGYGARAGDELEFNAPLAPRTSSQCVPVS